MSILYVGALKHGSTSTGILEVALSDNNSPTLFLFKAKPETMRRYYALHFACCLGQVCWSAISPNLQTVQYEFQKMKPAATNAICVLQRPLRCSAGRWGGGSSGGGGRAGWDPPLHHLCRVWAPCSSPGALPEGLRFTLRLLQIGAWEAQSPSRLGKY